MITRLVGRTNFVKTQFTLLANLFMQVWLQLSPVTTASAADNNSGWFGTIDLKSTFNRVQL